MKRSESVGSVFLLLVLAILGCGDSGSQVTAFAEDDPARMAAEIDHGPAGTTNSDVYPYESVLDELAGLCSESPTELLDMAVAGRNALEDDGTDISVLGLLEETAGMTQAAMETTGSKEAGSCQGLIAAAMVARNSG